MSEPRKFRAALVQLRTGRDVIRNIDAAAKLVREATALGADYVQTPEQTSLMELDRKSLFGHIFEEEHDTSARRVPGIWPAISRSICTSARSR